MRASVDAVRSPTKKKRHEGRRQVRINFFVVWMENHGLNFSFGIELFGVGHCPVERTT